MKEKKYGLGWIFSKMKGMRFLLAICVILVLAETVLTLAIAFFLREFVDIATGHSTLDLLTVGLAAIAVTIFSGIISMVLSIMKQYIIGKTERGLRVELMRVILTRRAEHITKQHTGELLTRLTADVTAVSSVFMGIIRNIVGGLASIVFATAAIFFLHWQMAIIMLVLTPVLMVVMSIFTSPMKKASVKDLRNEEVNRSLMQENLSRLVLNKAYLMQATVSKKIQNAYTAKLRSGIKVGMWQGLIEFLGGFVAWAIFLVCLGVGAFFVLRGDTTLGALVAIVQLLNYVVNPVTSFAGAVTEVGKAMASSKRIGEIMDLPADTALALASAIDATELVAEKVCFSYEGADSGDENTVLNCVDAVFQKGYITGIAGKSGSGKSTLLKLLIGLYAPKDGTVELKYKSGVVSGDEIMAQIAYVPPVDYLFSGAVFDNIIMSEDSARISDMESAAADANILDFIQSLPEGFDTQITESGGNVSSGQAQRIAIARAIYKRSPVVVFDEPTANLDAVSIEKFKSAVKRLAGKGKICIIVTHDVSTIDICDKVYVIEDGRLRVKRADEKLNLDEHDNHDICQLAHAV